MKTSNQVALELNIAPRTVQKWALELGLPKFGRTYVLTDAQVREVAAAHYPKRGRPPKSTE